MLWVPLHERVDDKAVLAQVSAMSEGETGGDLCPADAAFVRRYVPSTRLLASGPGSLDVEEVIAGRETLVLKRTRSCSSHHVHAGVRHAEGSWRDLVLSARADPIPKVVQRRLDPAPLAFAINGRIEARTCVICPFVFGRCLDGAMVRVAKRDPHAFEIAGRPSLGLTVVFAPSLLKVLSMEKLLSRRLADIPDSAVSSIISAAAQSGWSDTIQMAGGEPTFDWIAHPAEILADFSGEMLTRYSPFRGFGELLDLIRDKLARVNGLTVSTEDLVVVPGGAGALWGALTATCDPGDEVVLTDPCWEHYHAIVRLIGARPTVWSLFADHMNGEVDWDALDRILSPRTRAILINTPLNPCGYVFPEQVLARLVELCARRGIRLICDEEYEAFVFGPRRHVSPRTFSDDVVVLHSMSKSFAMTGTRVGYVVAPRDVGHLVRRAALYSYMYPSSTAQCLAIGILRRDYVNYLDRVRAHYEEKMTRLHRALATMPDFDEPPPEGGVYLFPRLGNLNGRNLAHTLIERDHLLCVPGDVAGESGRGRLRLFFGVGDQLIDQAAARIVSRRATSGT